MRKPFHSLAVILICPGILVSTLFAKSTGDHLSGPEIVFANLFHADSIEVVFDRFINPVPETRFSIDGYTLEILQYEPDRSDRIVIAVPPVPGAAEWILLAENLIGSESELSLTAEAPVAKPLKPGEVVFNEIMYRPLADNRDGIPDQSEYLEILNRSSYTVSLEGIFLHDEPDENGEVSVISPVSTTYRYLTPGGYLVIYPEPADVELSESRTGIYFGLGAADNPKGLRVHRSTLSLFNSGRQVYLADSSGAEIDMVHYEPGWHNPNLISTLGISLERISPDLESNDPGNWSSSVNSLGGTPVTVNSVFQQLPDTRSGEMQGGSLTLSPNPFSPDDDGFDDRLFIHYELDEPDYMVRVRIFDRYGRLVRTLADGEPAGFTGNLIWDGLTDDGQRNRVGIYIIHLDAYNSANGKRSALREIAVLARRF
jgi:hypothetical protein